ncbi:MAG: hypothetical protein AAF982_07010 [Pseudomonadota bacterium]
MRLTAPTIIVFLISLVLAGIGILPLFGISVPSIGLSSIWTLALAYVLLAAGVLFRGL